MKNEKISTHSLNDLGNNCLIGENVIGEPFMMSIPIKSLVEALEEKS